MISALRVFGILVLASRQSQATGTCSQTTCATSPDHNDTGNDDEEYGQFTPGTLRIPRESNLSVEDFYKKYSETETPVIIQDYAQAFDQMTRENILDACGEVKASVARRVSAQEGNWASIEWHWSGTLAKSMKEIADLNDKQSGKGGDEDEVEPGVEGSIVGVFDWSLQQFCPQLLERHFRVPKYLAQDYLQRFPPHVPLHYRDSWPSLFVGVNATYGGNHRDVFGSSFWMYIIEGAKEWHVIDSCDDYDLFAPDKPRVRHYHDIVQQGELLIIPGHRWHQVRNVGKTLTLAGNFVSGHANLETMKREVEREANPGSYYQELKTTLLAPGFDSSIDYDQDDLTWEEFRSQARTEPATSPASAIDRNDKQALEDRAILVTGAGSPEVNGCYLPQGQYEGAFEFALHDADTGRTFEMFKVASDSQWWNIQERVDGAYPRPIHYGTDEHHNSSTALPGDKGWGSTRYRDYWQGKEPEPTVQLVDRNECVEVAKGVHDD